MGGAGASCRPLVSIALLLLLVGIRAAANATPPPPLWIPGWYDGANFDDAAQALISVKGLPPDRAPEFGRPGLVAACPVALDFVLHRAPAFSLPEARAPPLPR